MKEIIRKHLEMLCNQIGSRTTGSENNRIATEYVEKIFKSLDFSSYRQDFDCISWENNGALLEACGHQIEARPSDYSLECNLNADFVLIDSVESLESSNLKGMIVVLHGQLAQEPLSPKNFVFYNPEEHQRIIALLENKNPLAIITVSPIDNVFFPIIEDGDFNIPVAIIKKDSLPLLKEESDCAIILKIATNRYKSRASNIVARKGDGKKIILTAHIDTKPNTTGALDNACGVSVLLAVAERIKDEAIDTCLEFAILNGEDYFSTPGEVAYMNKYLNSVDDFKLCINVDGIGLKDSNTTYSFYECDDIIKGKILAEAQETKELIEIEQWPQGDHMMFVVKGIPSIALTAEGVFQICETIIHTPQDNLSLVDMDKAADIADFLYRVIKNM